MNNNVKKMYIPPLITEYIVKLEEGIAAGSQIQGTIIPSSSIPPTDNLFQEGIGDTELGEG